MTKAKAHNIQSSAIQKKTITKGNRIIPIIPGFEIIPGSELEGSPLILRDPHTQSCYMLVSKIKAREILNKEITRLEKTCQPNDPILLEAEEECRKIKNELTKPEVRAVYHKVGKEIGLHSTTFRFAY